MVDDVQFDLVAVACFFKLLVDQLRRKRCRIERNAQFLGEIGHRTYVIFVGVGEDDTQQVLAPLLNKIEIGKQ